MTTRDNFLAKTKQHLSYSVGHRCSKPDCQRPTSGPSLGKEKYINMGTAAHITAAAQGHSH